MEHKKKLQKYYLYGLMPVLVIWILLSLIVNQLYGVFFLLGYIWPYMYYTPGFAEKASSRSYRFSLLGNLFKFQSYIFTLVGEKPPVWMMPLARLVVPFSMTGVLSMINPNWSPLWTILGWSMFEVFVFCNKKFKWDLL